MGRLSFYASTPELFPSLWLREIPFSWRCLAFVFTGSSSTTPYLRLLRMDSEKTWPRHSRTCSKNWRTLRVEGTSREPHCIHRAQPWIITDINLNSLSNNVVHKDASQPKFVNFFKVQSRLKEQQFHAKFQSWRSKGGKRKRIEKYPENKIQIFESQIELTYASLCIFTSECDLAVIK